MIPITPRTGYLRIAGVGVLADKLGQASECCGGTKSRLKPLNCPEKNT